MNRSRIGNWLRSRRNKKALRPFTRWRRLFLETLEERVLLTATWKNSAGGDWSVASNWTSRSVPGSDEDVVIDVPSALVTITHSTGIDTVRSLVSNENLILSGGSLSVKTTVQVTNTFTLSGGTLADATIVTGTTLKGTGSGGTLSNVTLQDNLDLTGSANANVSVTGPLTLDNGSVSLGNATGGYGVLHFNDAAALLTGNGSVVFSNFANSVYSSLQENVSGGTLTLGPGITVHGGSGSIGYNANFGGFANVSVVNQGQILADSAGNLTLNGTNWTSSGTLQASGGGALTLGGTGLIRGTFNVSDATLNLAGSFATSDLNLSSFTRIGGTVNLTGTLNNSGTTLALNAATGSWTLLGGTITGGTVSVSGDAELVGTNSGGTLSGGVTLRGDPNLTLPQALDLTSAANVNVSVSGGALTLSNVTVALGNSSGSYGVLRFNDAAAVLTGNGSVVFSNFANSVYSSLQENVSGGTLTIGPGITVHGGSGSIGYNANYGGFADVSVVNQGQILADNAGTLTVNGVSVTNTGTFLASNGATLTVPSGVTNFSGSTLSGGTWQVYANSTLRVIEPSSVVTNAGSILLDGIGANFYRDSGTTSALTGLAANTAAGSLIVQNGATLTTTAGFSNAGALTLGSSSTFIPTGTFTQTGGSTSLQGGTFGRILTPPGNDLTFDGVKQYVSVPSSPSLNLTSQVTVEAWIRPDSLSSSEMGIAGTWDDVSGNNRTYFLWILNGKASFYVAHNGGGDFANVNGVTALQVGTWYHIAGTFDGTNLRIYVNGVLEGTTTSAGAINTNSKPFFIGRQDAGDGNRYFAGAIDDVRVWSTARSASAIQANMGDALVGNEAGLAGYWKLDEGSGTTTADATANGNTGTLGAGVAANQPAWSVAPSPFSVNLQGGTLTGSGTVNGDVVNAATLSPGTPTGTLTINGAYTQTSAGTLNIDLSGTTPGSQFDQINVAGAAALGGTLNVTPLNGYLPNNGDTFQILTFAARSGRFDTVNGLNIGKSANLRANYSAGDVTLVSEVNGITINPTFGLLTTQSGGSAAFTVVLNSQPTANVSFGLTSSNTGAGTISASSLTFTPANWNVPQTVTVTGVDDFIDDGDVAYTIITSAATSADPSFNGFDPSDVSVVNQGSHRAGITVTPISGLVTTEAGGTAAFTVVLNSKPLANVTVGLTSSNTAEGTVSSGSLTFTPANWNVPQTVTVTGADDFIVDGNAAYTIVTGKAVSSDPKYSQLDPPDVSVINDDNDTLDLYVGALSLTPSSGLQSSGTLLVNWTDATTGSIPTPGAFTDSVTIKNLTTNQVLTAVSVPYDPGTPGNGAILPGGSRNRQFSYRLPDGSAGVGIIQVTVTTNSSQSISESDTTFTNNTAATSETSTLALYPDLQVANLRSDPASGLQAGGTVNLSWDDQNTGNGDTTNNGTRRGSFYDYLLVQRVDGNGAVIDTLVSTPFSANPLSAGASGHQQYSFRLPDGAGGTGNLRVTVITDYADQVFESNSDGTAETNNTATLNATAALPAYPDLQVTSPAVVSTSGLPLQSGDSLTVTWTDSNTGTGPVGVPFYDHVTIVNTATGQTLTEAEVLYNPVAAGNGAIAAQDGRARQFAFSLPQGSAGAGELVATVRTDQFNQVFEYNTAGTGGTSTAEGNNTNSATANSTLAPYADLVASAVTAPSLTVGDPARVTIGWTVTNQGTSATGVDHWVYSIIVSPDDNPANGTILKQFPHQGALAVNGQYTQSQTFLLPPTYQIHAHLFVRTDADDVIFENGSESNNFGEAPDFFDVTPIPYADLAVSSVGADSAVSTGQSIHVSWTVSNVAPNSLGTTNTSEWNDTISLATDPAGKNIVETLGTFDHIGALAIGGSYTRSVLSASIPLDVPAGNYYVVIKTGGPFEFIYTDNNTAVVASPLVVSLTPPPDLTTTHLAATTPDSTAELTAAAAGDKIDVTWTVTNVGAGDAGGIWYDYQHLIEVGGTRDLGLGLFDYATPLPAGKSYTRAEQVQLPANVQGVFQLVLQTNSGTLSTPPIFENGAYGNNTLTDPDTLTLTVAPNPDLQVFSIKNTPTQANAGGTVGFDFTVINQGTVEARGQWTDDVYISLKNSLDGTAILLGQFGNQSALMAGEKYLTHTSDLVIPKRLSGPAFLIVDTNANGAVNEYPNGNNNVPAQPITINPEPPADLVTSQVVAPTEAFDGTTIAVTYHVSNLGDGPTDPTSWTDTIWLTRDRTRPNTTKGDVLLAALPHTGVLGNDPTVISPPTGYDITVNVTLPKHISGEFYITPWSDSFDVVLKSTQDVNVNPDDPSEQNSDNFKARPITVLLTPPPDLVVTNVSPQPIGVGGDSYVLQWTVKNQGTSPTEDATLFDQVYLSDKPTFVPPNTGQDIGNQWYLGTIEHDGTVGAGGTYSVRQAFQLTPEIAGKYVIVVTNTGQYPFAPTWKGRMPTTTSPTASPGLLRALRPTCKSPRLSPRHPTTPGKRQRSPGRSPTRAPTPGPAPATGSIAFTSRSTRR